MLKNYSIAAFLIIGIIGWSCFVLTAYDLLFRDREIFKSIWNWAKTNTFKCRSVFAWILYAVSIVGVVTPLAPWNIAVAGFVIAAFALGVSSVYITLNRSEPNSDIRVNVTVAGEEIGELISRALDNVDSPLSNQRQPRQSPTGRLRSGVPNVPNLERAQWPEPPRISDVFPDDLEGYERTYQQVIGQLGLSDPSSRNSEIRRSDAVDALSAALRESGKKLIIGHDRIAKFVDAEEKPPIRVVRFKKQ